MDDLLSGGSRLCQGRGRAIHNKGACIMKMATVGLDPAKNFFQSRGVDSHRHVVIRRQLRRRRRTALVSGATKSITD